MSLGGGIIEDLNDISIQIRPGNFDTYVFIEVDKVSSTADNRLAAANEKIRDNPLLEPLNIEEDRTRKLVFTDLNNVRLGLLTSLDISVSFNENSNASNYDLYYLDVDALEWVRISNSSLNLASSRFSNRTSASALTKKNSVVGSLPAGMGINIVTVLRASAGTFKDSFRSIPNPATGFPVELQFKPDADGLITIRIYTVWNKIVQTIKYYGNKGVVQKIDWDGRDINNRLIGNGYYVVIVEQNGKIFKWDMGVAR